MLRLPIRPKLFSFIRNLTSNSISAPRSFYFFKRLSISNVNAATVLRKAIISVKIGLQSMGYTKKSERSKNEGSGVKTISRGSSLFSFVRFLALRKVSSQEQASTVYKRCDAFIL